MKPWIRSEPDKKEGLLFFQGWGLEANNKIMEQKERQSNCILYLGFQGQRRHVTILMGVDAPMDLLKFI